MNGFDFTAAMRTLCADMAQRLPELSHLDVDRVAVSFVRARNASHHGIYASLTPLRFARGAATTRRRGQLYAMQRVVDPRGVDMLYILSFYLPRFMELPFREKLVTVLHELWHVSPEFDGDIRRHPGRCFAHSSSQRDYDQAMGQLLERWQAAQPPAERYDFLQGSWDDLCRRFGRVVGTRVRRPRLLPIREG